MYYFSERSCDWANALFNDQLLVLNVVHTYKTYHQSEKKKVLLSRIPHLELVQTTDLPCELPLLEGVKAQLRFPDMF